MNDARNFHASDPLLAGVSRLKFLNATKSEAGLAELVGKGWKVLATFGPLADGDTFALLGESNDDRIAQLEAELARLRGGQ